MTCPTSSFDHVWFSLFTHLSRVGSDGIARHLCAVEVLPRLREAIQCSCEAIFQNRDINRTVSNTEVHKGAEVQKLSGIAQFEPNYRATRQDATQKME